MDEFKTNFPPEVFSRAVDENQADGLNLKEARKRIYEASSRGKKRALKQARKTLQIQQSVTNFAAEPPASARPVSIKEDHQDCYEANDIPEDNRFDAELDVVDHYAALQSTLTLPNATYNGSRSQYPPPNDSLSEQCRSKSSNYTNDTRINNARVVGDHGGQIRPARIPSIVSEQSEGEYVNPRSQWKSSSAQDRAQAYRDLLPAQTQTSIWDDITFSNPDKQREHATRVSQLLAGQFSKRSERGSEWLPMNPNPFQAELDEANSRKSRLSSVRKPRTEHSSSGRSESKRKYSESQNPGYSKAALDLANALATKRKPVPAHISSKPRSRSSVAGGSNSSPSNRSQDSHNSWASSSYSTDASTVHSLRDSERRSSNASKRLPDSGRFRDRPSTGTPNPRRPVSNNNIRSTQWGDSYDVDDAQVELDRLRDELRRAESRGKGKRRDD